MDADVHVAEEDVLCFIPPASKASSSLCSPHLCLLVSSLRPTAAPENTSAHTFLVQEAEAEEEVGDTLDPTINSFFHTSVWLPLSRRRVI